MFRKTITGSILLMASTGLYAETPSYSYIGLSYETADIDDLGFDYKGTGFGLEGSWAINESFFIDASYFDVEDDFLGIDISYDETRFSVGYSNAFSETSSFYVKGGYLDVGASGAGVSVSDNGYQLGTGIRSNISENIELNGSVSYGDIGDDSATRGDIGLIWHIGQTFGVTADIGRDSDATYYGVGARLSF